MRAITSKDALKGMIALNRTALLAVEDGLVALKRKLPPRVPAATPSSQYPYIYSAQIPITPSFSKSTGGSYIRIQDDAPFLCTAFMCVVRHKDGVRSNVLTGFNIVDESSGRDLNDAAAGQFIPSSLFKGKSSFSTTNVSSLLGGSFVYELPSVFAIPKNGVIRVDAIYNLKTGVATANLDYQIYFGLLGTKIFGG